MSTLRTAVDTPRNIPRTDLERRAWVVLRLRRRGTSLRELARQEGVRVTSLSEALSRPSSHMEQVIADACGVTVEQLFPERFDADTGVRLYRTRPPVRKGETSTATQPSPNVHHEKAA